MIVLKFTPLDVLMFRDGRPFNMETDHATSLMFPSPHTTAGAIRKLIGTLLNIPSDEWNKLLGDWKSTPLKITGPFLYTEKHGILVEAPKILLKHKKTENGKPERILKPINSNLLDISKTSKSEIMEKIPWTKTLKPLEPVSGFVRITDLIDFCKDSSVNLRIFPKTLFLETETRTHTRMEGKTVAEEGGKFSVRYLRLKDASFIMILERGTFERWNEFERIFKSNEKQVVKFGGENRQAVVKRVDDRRIVEIFKALNELENSESKLRVFITPFVIDENPKIEWAVTSRPIFKRARNFREFSGFFTIYEPGSVFDFKDLSFFESETFKNFRSLGYNVSLGVRPWWED